MNVVQALDIHEKLKPIKQKEIDCLKEVVRGNVILSSDKQYDHHRSLWNGMIDKRPAFIVECTGTTDVVEAVKFAKDHNLLISVRGAGHNIAGRALNDQVMLIDLQNLRSVHVDPIHNEAIVSPGATLGDIDHETQTYGLALPVGINSTTGIAGLTLGGGFGWLSRKYGMTIDNLISAELVTPDGDVLVCDKTHYPDLYWAIRGGGGNFGIITSFRFKLHPVGPTVEAGPIIFKLDEAKSILKKYRTFCQSCPETFSAWAVLRHAPPFPFLDKQYHGKVVLIIACICHGDAKTTKHCIDKIKSFGTPIGNAFGPHQYKQFQAVFDPLLTPGSRNYWKSHNFESLNDATLDVVIQYAKNLPGAESEIFIAQMGGVVNAIEKEATAYPHRDIEFIMNVHTRWQDPKDDKKCIEWARDFYKATLPFATGGVYVNFVSAGDDNLESAYGKNAQKLSQIKQKYDPQNRLRANLNIRP